VIEAWACGVPLIVTNAGGPAELVTHDVDGCLVPVRSSNRLAEAMEALLADSSKSERLSKHGRERSRSFDLVTHVKRVTALYPPPKTPTTLCRG